MLLFRGYLNPTLDAGFRIIEPVKLMLKVRQIPPAVGVIRTYSRRTPSKLVRNRQPAGCVLDLRGADQRRKVVRIVL